MAAPEKALIDLVYLQPAADSPEYLRELRLQHLDQLDRSELHRIVERIKKPKLERAAEQILGLMDW